MFALIVALLAVTGFGESKRGGQRCHKMELKQLCSKDGAGCRDRVPDYEHVCKLYRRSTDIKNTIIMSSEMVPYWDASKPVIIMLTDNQTVAPTQAFEIRCMAEGAPYPHIAISFKEDADLTPMEDSMNTVDIEKRVVQTVSSQSYSIYEDEGWYRCVARNAMGVTYQDTYLEIASEEDQCAAIECPDHLICEVDEASGEPGCTCPYCTDDDYDNDSNFYCGTDCGIYLARCSIDEERCRGRNVEVFSLGICPEFPLPEYSHIEPTETVVSFGTEVQLTCIGAVPSGGDAGPEPLIEWYVDRGEQFGGRERVGEGSVLSYMMDVGHVNLVCVGVHCVSSHDQSQQTDIHLFKLLIQEYLSVPTSEPYSDITSQRRDTLPPSTEPYSPFTTEDPGPTDKADGGSACQVVGDPYVSTFDNRWYKQDGVCTYVLAMECRAARWFVYGRFTISGSSYTSLETVTVYHARSVLELQRGWLLNNNGEKLRVTVGGETQFGSLSYSFDGEFLTIKFDDGNQIRWNGFNGVQILTSPDTAICGLCGNNNGESSDDFQARWRGKVDEPYAFVKSWGLRQRVTCYNNEQQVEASQEGVEACSSLFFNKYIIKCHDTVPVLDYELACARSYDTNTYEGWRAECNVLQSYILQCETRGLNLSQWRERTQCTAVEAVQKFTIDQGCPQEYPPV